MTEQPKHDEQTLLDQAAPDIERIKGAIDQTIRSEKYHEAFAALADVICDPLLNPAMSVEIRQGSLDFLLAMVMGSARQAGLSLAGARELLAAADTQDASSLILEGVR
jgi:hypothetical protein